MTERGLPGMDGAPACPFVAFGDDRDGRSTSPDHRHRCFAESPSAPRAVAHQEAYCLSSAFPVCPTFQDWARREAAHARGAGERPEAAPSAVVLTAPDASDVAGGPPPDQPAADDRSTRNPPRAWAAPPPWASGTSGPAGTGGTTRPDGASPATAGMAAGTVSGVTPTSPAEGQGLAGSAADRLALGVAASGTAWSASSAGTVSTSADDELAELVRGRPVAAPPTASGAGGYPPPTRTGARPPVSSTRPAGEAITGPTWERIQRFEAYPTIKTKTGMRGAPRIAVLAGAVGIAAIALFMLPALLGIGGGPSSSVKPGGSGGASTASPAPTAVPAPTPLVYIVKKGDNLGKIAKKHGVTIDELLAVNPEITNPNEISLGQVIVIPLSASDPPPKPTPKASASASS